MLPAACSRPLQAGAQTVSIEIRTVQRNVVIEPVPPAETEITVAARVNSRKVTRAPLYRWKLRDLLGVDECRRARPAAVEDCVVLRRDNDFLSLHRLFHEPEVDARRLSKPEIQIFLALAPVADVRDGDSIRPADSHVLDVILTVDSRGSAVLGAGRFMDCNDICARKRITLIGGDKTGHRRSGYTLTEHIRGGKHADEKNNDHSFHRSPSLMVVGFELRKRPAEFSPKGAGNGRAECNN